MKGTELRLLIAYLYKKQHNLQSIVPDSILHTDKSSTAHLRNDSVSLPGDSRSGSESTRSTDTKSVASSTPTVIQKGAEHASSPMSESSNNQPRGVRSTHSFANDSTVFNDSLAASDSARNADALSTTNTIVGMDGIPHPSLPATESWTFMVIMILFLFLVAGILQSAESFTRNFKSFFSKKDPVKLIESPTSNSAQYQIFITLFSIIVFAFSTYLYLYKMQGNFDIRGFGVLLLVFVGVYLLKNLLFEVVGNTFFNQHTTRMYKSMYFSMTNVLAILIFPLTILYIYQPVSWQTPLIVAVLVLVGMFYIILIIKLFQIFYTKFLVLFYIFLYLCTLEILPILILIRVCTTIM